MGTKVLESRYDATIENPTAMASGTNRLCVAPVMKKAGMNTARMQSIATNRGSVVSAVASLAARARLWP
jgi:glucose-6-phosphate isomerase